MPSLKIIKVVPIRREENESIDGRINQTVCGILAPVTDKIQILS
jgi:hypothetical protein